MFDGIIIDMDCIDFIDDVKFSHEKVIDYIYSKFMNEQLCMTFFFF